MREQHLAARGRVQGRTPAQPVVRGDRRGPACLHDVDRRVPVQHGDVGGLPGLVGERPAHRLALLRDVQPDGGGPGQPQHPRAQVVLAALVLLFHEAAVLQDAQDAEGGGLVHPQFLGDLGDPGLAEPGQDLQHAHRAVHGLDGAGRAALLLGPVTGRIGRLRHGV